MATDLSAGLRFCKILDLRGTRVKSHQERKEALKQQYVSVINGSDVLSASQGGRP
jgi:tmRNA-binding protein